MSLVNYSDSEDDAPQLNVPQGTKRKWSSPAPRTAPSPLPPLPDSFHNCYASAARLSSQDDPALHGGRQRQTPHVEGNWPTHVYLEWFPSPEDSTRMQDIMTRVVADGQDSGSIHTLLKSDLGADLPLHISLSSPLVLYAEQRHGFMSALTRRISESDVAPFTIHTSTLSWHPNANSTRHFLVLGGLHQRDLQDNQRERELSKLMNASNATATEYDQPTLYTSSTPRSESEYVSKSLSSTAKRGRHKTRATRGLQLHEGAQSKKGAIDGRGTLQTQDNESDNKIINEMMVQKSHISIGWALKISVPLPSLPLPSSSLLAKEKEYERAQNPGADDGGSAEFAFAIRVDNVKVKMGNVVTVIPLSSSDRERRGATWNGIVER